MLDIAGHLDLAKLLEGDSSLALKLALTLDQHSIISITDIAGRITFVNNKFCQISGYNAKELLGQNHRILKSDYHNDEFYKDMWNTISSGNTWQGVVCNKRKDGSLYWVESTILPMLDEQGKPYQYISARTDITDSAQTTDRYSRSQQFARIGTWDWNIGSGELYWSDQIAPCSAIQILFQKPVMIILLLPYTPQTAKWLWMPLMIVLKMVRNTILSIVSSGRMAAPTGFMKQAMLSEAKTANLYICWGWFAILPNAKQPS